MGSKKLEENLLSLPYILPQELKQQSIEKKNIAMHLDRLAPDHSHSVKKKSTIYIHNTSSPITPHNYFPTNMEWVEPKRNKIEKPPSLIEAFRFFIHTQEDIQKKILTIVEIQSSSSNKKIQISKDNFKKTEKKLTIVKKRETLFHNISSILSLSGAVTSIIIGSSLLAVIPPTPINILGGTALILSGITSFSAFIAKQANGPSTLSTRLEIAGGILGLLSGGISLSVKIIPAIQASKALLEAFNPALKLTLKVGQGLLFAAQYSNSAISSLYQQKGLNKSALLKELDAEILVDQTNLECSGKLITHLSDVFLQNTSDLVEALEKEKNLLSSFTNQNNLRG